MAYLNHFSHTHQHSHSQVLKTCNPTVCVFQNCPLQQVMVCQAGVVKWSGGCASGVRMTIFEAFNFRPVVSIAAIQAFSNTATPSAVSLKIQMPSAKRRSRKGKVDIHHGNRSPLPSLRPMHANPHTHCNTEQNRRGLSTHPFRTLALIRITVLSPYVFTSPVCSL